MLSLLSDPGQREGLASSTDTPDVTFVVAAYNVAPFIEKAVRSALAQEDVKGEIIVVDDASSDDTAGIVERIAATDPRIVLIRQAQNAGPGAARNAALSRARGRWIAFLDGDDFVVPERTSKLLACAEAVGADIIGDNFERVTCDGKPTGRLLFPTADVPFLFSVDAPTFIAANEVLGKRAFSLGAIKVIIRSEFLSRHAISHVEDLPVGEDFQFILACLFQGARFVVTSEPGYKYRLRPGSQSWRLTNEHMAKLHLAYAEIAADAKRFGNAAAIEAVRRYGETLSRTTDFVKVVTLIKAGHWKNAALWASANPRCWPLIIRYGGEALANKLRRKTLRVQPG